jgi:hypothetical protein
MPAEISANSKISSRQKHSTPNSIPLQFVFSFLGSLIVEFLAASYSQQLYYYFTMFNIEVNINEGVLEIRGEKKEEAKDKQKKSYMVQESSSSFYRRMVLPRHADADKVDANFENGILKVIVPFKELPKPKKVDIKSGNK